MSHFGGDKMKPEKIGKLVDRALKQAWNFEDDRNIFILENVVKWGNFLPVWRFYRMYLNVSSIVCMLKITF